MYHCISYAGIIKETFSNAKIAKILPRLKALMYQMTTTYMRISQRQHFFTYSKQLWKSINKDNDEQKVLPAKKNYS